MMTTTAMTYEVPTMDGRGFAVEATRPPPQDAVPAATTGTATGLAPALSRIDLHQGQQIAGAVGIAVVLAIVARNVQRRWVASLATTEEPRRAPDAADEAMEREAFVAKYAAEGRYAVGSDYAKGTRT